MNYRRYVARITTLAFMMFFISCGGSNDSLIKFEVSDSVDAANVYIKDNIENVNQSFKNKYHLTSPIGWLNDPNGFGEFNGKYHLFYQYNPYEAVWGPMHWGHQTTKDFITWELEDVALAPDMTYDSGGCFSGTSIVENNIQYLAYTAVTDTQNQAIAYSYDGVTYKKLDDLILSGKDLPDGFSNNDFRDPKIFKRDGRFYLLVGNKNDKTNEKQIIMFESDEITGPYSYSSVIYSRSDVGGIFECPDLITIDGTDVLIASPQRLGSDNFYDMQNDDSCVYLAGNLSVKTNKFYKNTDAELQEFDKGFSFYAPQTMKTSDGRNIMVAWMKSWSEPNLTESHQWSGIMTLPRELTIKNNHVFQQPVREINNYLKNKVEVDDMSLNNEAFELEEFKSRTSRITLDILVNDLNDNTRCGIELYKGSNYSTKLYYDNEIKCLVLDRSNCGSLMSGKRYCRVEPINGKISLEIFLDVNSVEVFVNGGYYTMTATTYSPSGADEVWLYSLNGKTDFSNITKQEVVV